MKSLFLFGLLSSVLVLAFFLSQLANESRRESAVIGWSNSLIWEALELPDAFEFSTTSVHEEEDRPDLWIVIGQLTLRGPQGRPVPRLYTALIQKVCSTGGERRCWHLVELTVDGEPLVREGAPVAKSNVEGKQEAREAAAPGSEGAAPPSDVPTEAQAMQGASESSAEEVVSKDEDSPIPGLDEGVAAELTPEKEVQPLPTQAAENGQSASPDSEASLEQPPFAAPRNSDPPIPRRRP